MKKRGGKLYPMPRDEHLLIFGTITPEQICSGSISAAYLLVNGRWVEAKPPWMPVVHELLDGMEDASKHHGRPLRGSSRETIDKLRLALSDG